ncbi:MAG TPA: BrnT family toxin [Aestuariivirgaceae bacterium]|nr:BrnT family toxin [Aestuariivirgaceae bacterium]
MPEHVSVFDWDEGNRAKCEKHGVTMAEIEALFQRTIMVLPDEAHSQREQRVRAVGRTETGRYVFLVFTFRERGGERLIRPISARYMHSKEVRHFEKENSYFQNR